MTYPNAGYGQPQMGYPQPQGYSTGQLPFDANIADYYVNLVTRMLQERNYQPEFRTFFGRLLNWRQNTQSTMSNVARLVTETQQRLMSLGVNLNQTVPEGFTRQALDAYLADRIPKVMQEFQNFMRQQQMPQQQMGYTGYPQPQMYGQPQQVYGQQPGYVYPGMQQTNPNDPMGVLGSMGGGMGMAQQPWSPVMECDPLPNLPQTQSGQQTQDQPVYGQPQQAPAQPQQTAYGHTQTPVSQQPVADPTAQLHHEFFDAQQAFNQPAVNPMPSPVVAPQNTGVMTADLNLNFTHDAVPHDLGAYIDDDLVGVSKISSSPVKGTTAQASIVTVKPACNTMDDAVTALEDGLPDEFTEGEFFNIIDFKQLHCLPIPTDAFILIREKVVEKYTTGDKDWRALLEVMEDTATRHSQVLNAFLVDQINRGLARFYRTEDDMRRLIRIDTLWDINDLIVGKFSGPLKDQHDWKGRLDKIMHEVIQHWFIDLEIVDENSDHKADIIRCDQVKQIVDGVSKFDLAFVDEVEKEKWLAGFFAVNTLIRYKRLVAITNMVNAQGLVSEDLYQGGGLTDAQSLFFASFAELCKVHGQQHVESVYFVKGNSFDLSRDNLLAGKVMIYPYLKTPEGSGTQFAKSRRPHVVDTTVCYGNR